MISQRSEDIAQLNRFAAAGNSQAPMMVNDFTRLDSVSVEYPAIVFHYTLMFESSEVDIGAFKSGGLQWFKENACSNQQALSMVLEPGYEIRRRYSGIDEKHVMDVDLNIGMCHENT